MAARKQKVCYKTEIVHKRIVHYKKREKMIQISPSPRDILLKMYKPKSRLMLLR